MESDQNDSVSGVRPEPRDVQASGDGPIALGPRHDSSPGPISGTPAGADGDQPDELIQPVGSSGSTMAQSDIPSATASRNAPAAETDVPLPRRRRLQLSAFLVTPAKRALRKRRWQEVIPLYQALLVARGPGSSEALSLSRAWAGVGQRAEAIEVLDAFIAANPNKKARRRAQRRRDNLARPRETPTKDFTQGFNAARLNRYARLAFRRGRDAFRKKRYADALLYFKMGNALDPELPGFLRELGATYDKLGLTDKRRSYYWAYLLARPFGKNADTIRKSLIAEKQLPSRLAIHSSLPCDEVWLNGQRVPGKLPVEDLPVAPGPYRALCVSYKHEIAYFEYARVEAGGSIELSFRWAVVVNRLREPYGRIVIENPRVTGVMMDLGISNPEVGVIVPDDSRSLRMILKDDAGARREERSIELQPGQRHVIKW